MLKVFLRAPILTQSGYGHHARTVYRALKTREDIFDIYVQPIQWGKTSWLWADNEERKELDECLSRTIAYINNDGKFDVALQVTIPGEFEQLAPVNIGITAGIETDRVSAQWLQKCNMMNKILTISEHSMNSLASTVYDAVNNQTGEQIKYGLMVPIDYISYPVLQEDPEEIDLDLKTDFNFLTIAQMGPRKNLNATIDAFVDNFRDNGDVGLIIKTNMAKNSLLDRMNTTNALRVKLAELGERKCKVYLLHGSLTEKEMAALYTDERVKALISTSHGEGFGLPLFEAAYYGLPVLATDWSGHLDFLYKKTKQKNGKTKSKHLFGKISYKLDNIPQEAVWDGVLIKESRWAYPEVSSIKNNMLELHKDHGRFKKRAKELQKWVCEEFSQEKMYNKYVEAMLEVMPDPNAEDADDWFNDIEDIIKEYE